jgi:toxin ParE1/3/4
MATAEAAEKVVRAIDDACRLVGEHPLAGRSRDEIRPGLRSVGARPYIVFYRVRDEHPEIVRVLHGRRDIGRIFRGITGS